MADNLAPLVARGFDLAAPNGFQVVLAIYAFTFQIYGDFSGYSDIARGLGRLFGVQLTQNFDVPLFAASPRELWHRWHISLSRWLRDYLYIPLGGNRVRPGLNLMLTMLLGGLWHGANWTFVLWGAWHGAGLAAQRALGNAEPRGMLRLLAIPLMFHFTVLGFAVFRAPSVTALRDRLQIAYFDPIPRLASDGIDLRLAAAVIVPVLLVDFVLLFRKDVVLLPRYSQPLLLALSIAAVVLLGATSAQTFIYFQF